jgi:hypothetical protein
MRELPEPRGRRFCEAYLRMAEEARYRPQAPGDGFGHVCLTKAQVADPERHRLVGAFPPSCSTSFALRLKRPPPERGRRFAA